MTDVAAALLSFWARRAEEGKEIWVWAPWMEVLQEAQRRWGDGIRVLPLSRPGRTATGERVRAWWVPWEGPRVHHPIPLTEDVPALPEPETVWAEQPERVQGRLPLREIRWPVERPADLYALVVLLQKHLPRQLVAGWLGHYTTHPDRFETEVREYLERFFRDPQHLRALLERYPRSFRVTRTGWRWEVPDIPRYLRQVERYPPQVVVDVALLPEHLPIFHARLAHHRPLDLFQEPSLPWPPEPRGWSRSPRKEPWARFFGGWVWIPELPGREASPVVAVVRGRHAIPGVPARAPCGHMLPPPENREDRVLRVNGISLTLAGNLEDLPPLAEVERFHVHVEELPERMLPPPPPLSVAGLIRHTPENILRRLPHWLEVLVDEGLLLDPLCRDVHADLPFAEIARRLIVRFLERENLFRDRDFTPRPGELVPVAPLLPQDLMEVFPRRVDLRELEKVWERIVRHFMAHFMSPARIREVKIRVRHRRQIVAEQVIPVGVVDPGFTLALPLTLHPLRGGKLVPVRLDVTRTTATLSERLARLAALCPETPLSELISHLP